MAESSHYLGRGAFTVADISVSNITRFVETKTNVSASDNSIDISHLGITTTVAISISALPDPSVVGQSPTEFQIDYIGDTVTGPLFYVGQTSTAHTVTAASFTLSVNDVPRGSVTFSVG